MDFSKWMSLIFLMSCVPVASAVTSTTVVTSSTTTTTTTTDEGSPPQPSATKAPSCQLPSAATAGPGIHGGATEKPPGNDAPAEEDTALQFTVEPRAVEEGRTPRLEIRCTFSPKPTEPLSRVMMLSLFRIRDKEPYVGRFEIETVNLRTGTNVSKELFSIYGKADPKGLSYLNYTINNPQEADTGTYLCTFIGLSTSKYPVFLKKSIRVATLHDSGVFTTPSRGEASTTPGTKTNLSPSGQNLEMADESKVASAGIDELTRDLNRVSAALQNLTEKLATVEKAQVKFDRRMDSARHSLFGFPIEQPLKHYYLSNYEFQYSLVAQATCEIFGGYLAELRDYTELKVLQNLIPLKNPKVDAVLIGGTDEAEEGKWKTRFSFNNPEYFEWGEGEPSQNRSRNCLVLSRGHGWRMGDYPCHNTESKTLFLCEVPVKV
ncbi:unnamed protein product [Lymnaea stagnalis]|uniref:C-type lectin domain-containing protein n=1 Tax=Lymnaea stagnalis TaxID=6523 RepID=A0AAV2ILE2_LYMST